MGLSRQVVASHYLSAFHYKKERERCCWWHWAVKTPGTAHLEPDACYWQEVETVLLSHLWEQRFGHNSPLKKIFSSLSPLAKWADDFVFEEEKLNSLCCIWPVGAGKELGHEPYSWLSDLLQLLEPGKTKLVNSYSHGKNDKSARSTEFSVTLIWRKAQESQWCNLAVCPVTVKSTSEPCWAGTFLHFCNPKFAYLSLIGITGHFNSSYNRKQYANQSKNTTKCIGDTAWWGHYDYLMLIFYMLHCGQAWICLKTWYKQFPTGLLFLFLWKVSRGKIFSCFDRYPFIWWQSKKHVPLISDTGLSTQNKVLMTIWKSSNEMSEMTWNECSCFANCTAVIQSRL